ncbi:MAG: hypothetical protein VKO64_09380 [Candidatus Sericytochromatia bacterium]|nr:hypothetical protein [Candidatus Sericytochromatia bacterium]
MMLLAFVFILMHAVSSFLNVDDRLKLELDRRKLLFQKAFESRFDTGANRSIALFPGKGEVQVITFSSSLLFEQGKWDLKPAGRQQLLKLAPLLKEFLSRDNGFKEIRVCGHTNSDPFLTWDPRCPTNWHLSSLRATAVVFLLGNLVGFRNLSAVGFADNRPYRPGEKTLLDKESQKRIEIELYYSKDWIEEVSRGSDS